MKRVATLIAAAAGVLAAVTLVPDGAVAGHGHGGHGGRGGHGWHGGHAWHGGGHWGGGHWRGWGGPWWGWGWGPGIAIGPGYYGGRCWSNYYGWVPCRRSYGWY